MLPSCFYISLYIGKAVKSYLNFVYLHGDKDTIRAPGFRADISQHRRPNYGGWCPNLQKLVPKSSADDCCTAAPGAFPKGLARHGNRQKSP